MNPQTPFYQKPLFIWMLGLVTLINFGYNGIWGTINNISIDFGIYYGWAQHIRDGYPYIMNVKNAHHMSFYYPPFWGLILQPFLWLPNFNWARMVWLIINLGFMGLTVAMFQSWLKTSPLYQYPWYRWGLLLMLLNFSPMFDSLIRGQANFITLFLLVSMAWFYSRNRYWETGLALSLAIMIKLLPLVFIIYWIWKKETRVWVSTLLGTLGLALISWIALGTQAHLKFLTDTRLYVEFVKIHWMHQGNISLYALLREGQAQHVIPSFISTYGMAIGVAVGIALLMAVKVSRKPVALKQTLLENGLLATSTFLAVAYCEHHQFLLAFLGYAVIWKYWDSIDSVWPKISLALSWILISSGFQMDNLDIPDRVFNNYFLSIFTSLYGVLVLWTGLAVALWFHPKTSKEKDL